MMKKIAITAGILLVIAVAAGVAARYVDTSRRTFNSFCERIRLSEFEHAQTYVAPGLLGQNSNHVWVVHMSNGDMPAERFAVAQVRKVRRSRDRDIVIFSMSSKGDMAHIEGGKFTYVKCP